MMKYNIMMKSSVLLIAMATGASAKWTGSAPSTRLTSSSGTCAAAKAEATQWTTTSLVATETTTCSENEHGIYLSTFDCDTMVAKTKKCTGGDAADRCSGTCSPIDGDANAASGLIIAPGDSASCTILKNPTTNAVAFVDIVKSVTTTEGSYWGEAAKTCAKKAGPSPSSTTSDGSSPAFGENGASAALPRTTLLTVVLSVLAILLGSH